MKLEAIYENLCYNDKRNPLYIEDEYADEDEVKVNKDCYCDNCFYRRHELAIEILRLRALTIESLPV